MSTAALALFFVLVIPGIDLYLAIALGALLSPTDAVATSIVKKLGISPRVVTMLEGESLLNDATSLVLLRTAIAAIAVGSVPVGGAIWAFVWGVFIAVVIGALVGLLALRVRAWVRHSAANTALSFVVPFVAYLPTEQLGGSGLVAAVVAGIVTGQGAARWFTPEQRLSDELNWRTVELMLEGAVFLVMGLQLKEIVRANIEDHEGLWRGAWLAVSAVVIILVVRSGYVAVLVSSQGRRARRLSRERLESFSTRIDAVAAQGGRLRADGRARRTGIPREARAAIAADAQSGLTRARRPRLLPVLPARLEARHRHRVGRHARRGDPRRRADAAGRPDPGAPGVRGVPGRRGQPHAAGLHPAVARAAAEARGLGRIGTHRRGAASPRRRDAASPRPPASPVPA